MQNQGLTCPNPSCGKAFSAALKAENLSSKNGSSYDACPYCLTEIVVEASSLGAVEEQENKQVASEEPSIQSVETKQSLAAHQTVDCQHQLGYLSKRSSKEKIPEECMMCGNIVQCMLKNVTG